MMSHLTELLMKPISNKVFKLVPPFKSQPDEYESDSSYNSDDTVVAI